MSIYDLLCANFGENDDNWYADEFQRTETVEPESPGMLDINGGIWHKVAGIWVKDEPHGF